MSDPLRLVTGPTVAETIRAEVIELLERALDEARRGEVTEVFMILKHPGTNKWSDLATSTQSLTDWIGKLEVTKHAWIEHFNQTERKCDE